MLAVHNISRAQRYCFMQDHDHDHGHEYGRVKPVGEEDDCCGGGGDCCGDKSAGAQDHDHGHSHGHSHGHVHGHGHSADIAICVHGAPGPNPCPLCIAVPVPPLHGDALALAVTPPIAIAASAPPEQVCASCSTMSNAVPHAVQVTRIRLSNLCCAMEERIVLSTLQGRHGIESVAVNVVGRYAVVKHCNVACCAPVEKIVELLNAERLGAAVQEAGAEGDIDAEGESMPWLQLGFGALLLAMFFCGVAVQEEVGHDSAAALGVFLANTVLGTLPILYTSFVSVVLRRTLDIHVLILVAVAGSLASDEYLDAALIVSLFCAAEAVEQAVLCWVRRAVASTTASVPRTCYLADGKSVSVQDLRVGDIIAVRAGDMVLADGTVLKGEGSLDESSLTGEAVPVLKRMGDVVSSGGVVTNGYMEISVTVLAADSTLARLKQAVQDVQADKGQYSRLVDVFSLYWTPATLLFTLLFVTIGGGVSGDWDHYTQEGIILLVLACPCSIVIATPIPSVCTIAVAARNGVLIRGSSVVERMGAVRAVAVDKTGTLTTGFFAVQELISLLPSLISSSPSPSIGSSEAARVQAEEEVADALSCAAALEEKSSHPLAAAIISAHVGGCLGEFALSGAASNAPAVRKVKVVEGVGVSGWVAKDAKQTDWRFVVVGNERMVEQGLAEPLESEQQQQILAAFRARHPTASIVLVAIDDKLHAALALSDSVRPDASAFVSALSLESEVAAPGTASDDHEKKGHRSGLLSSLSSLLGLRPSIEVSMLTGDARAVAEFVCAEVGIGLKNCFARLLPNGKLDWVTDRQQGGAGRSPTPVLMVGDGINDAAALAAASVGCAMGNGGSAMAVTAADVVLLSNSLARIPAALMLSRVSRAVMLFNCVFSIGLKAIAVALALAGELTLWAAILVDVGTLVVVVAVGLLPLVVPLEWSVSKSSPDSSSASVSKIETANNVNVLL